MIIHMCEFMLDCFAMPLLCICEVLLYVLFWLGWQTKVYGVEVRCVVYFLDVGVAVMAWVMSMSPGTV
jgi:hypothetical protein